MLKKIMLGLVVATALMPVSVQARSPDPTYCLIIAGCFWNGAEWVCADPALYADCVEP
ncbi:hypothetical protein [Brevundimonas sp.]|uniref:hypothetical protein n=1 Tax=Brevundimonas sp. TaxID=1871086 RepID=UPI002619800F|nr:hypothetical protein [Brevundimonas sp.]